MSRSSSLAYVAYGHQYNKHSHLAATPPPPPHPPTAPAIYTQNQVRHCDLSSRYTGSWKLHQILHIFNIGYFIICVRSVQLINSYSSGRSLGALNRESSPDATILYASYLGGGRICMHPHWSRGHNPPIHHT